MPIHAVSSVDHPGLVQLWEASVRATHDFLPSGYIDALRPRMATEFLPAVDLRAWSDDAGPVLGFVGVAQGNVEMLFVAPEARGRGIGAALLRHAIDAMGARSVDVNEQNPQATGFYLRMGFEIAGRSPLDGQGEPFPLLHLRLG